MAEWPWASVYTVHCAVSERRSAETIAGQAKRSAPRNAPDHAPKMVLEGPVAGPCRGLGRPKRVQTMSPGGVSPCDRRWVGLERAPLAPRDPVKAQRGPKRASRGSQDSQRVHPLRSRPQEASIAPPPRAQCALRDFQTGHRAEYSRRTPQDAPKMDPLGGLDTLSFHLPPLSSLLPSLPLQP